MSCFNPMVSVLAPKGSINKKPKMIVSWDKIWKNTNISLPKCYSLLPCRQCIGCRLEYSRQWAIRSVHEASLWPTNSFLTLTYNNASLPSRGSLQMKDMQEFWKRLRYHYKDKIRYYYCGEYGGKTFRPHYHSVTFNYFPDDAIFWKSVNGQNYYTSARLSEIWGKGYVVVGSVSFNSAAYVARYSAKKVTGKKADDHYSRVDLETGEVYQLKPEFSIASRGSGIGYGYYKKWFSDMYPSDQVIIDGKSMRPPKYYDVMLQKDNPDMYESIKLKRQAFFDRQVPSDREFRRLVARERVAKQRMERLVRAMEAEA